MAVSSSSISSWSLMSSATLASSLDVFMGGSVVSSVTSSPSSVDSVTWSAAASVSPGCSLAAGAFRHSCGSAYWGSCCLDGVSMYAAD